MSKEKQHVSYSVLILAGVCLLSLAVMIAALFYTSRPSEAAFTPPPFDSSAVVGVPDVPDDLGWQELDAEVFKASVCGKIVIHGNMADIWLTNPESNTVWLKLRVLDESGAVLGETGLIKPGEYVQTVAFDAIPPSGTPISMKLMAYQPETYYSEGVITLNTTVQ